MRGRVETLIDVCPAAIIDIFHFSIDLRDSALNVAKKSESLNATGCIEFLPYRY